MTPTPAAVLLFGPTQEALAATLAARLTGTAQVVLAGSGSGPFPGLPAGVTVLHGLAGKGAALGAALAHVDAPHTVLLDVREGEPVAGVLEALLAPLREDTADAVYGIRTAVEGAGRGPGLVERSAARLAEVVTGERLRDPLTGARAFRTEVLRSLTFTSAGDGVDAELLVKVAAQRYRIAEVSLPGPAAARRSVAGAAQQLATLVRYGTLRNDADNRHEGYTTLAHMDVAHNYNAWLGRRFREHLGRRVLEIGAGIGTITREIEQDRELVVALEVDRFYVDRLRNMFRDRPHVQPCLSDVALADWEALRARDFDSVLLSNVLEHIPDDAAALRRFRQVLPEGGRLVLLVPALPELFGSMDEAVGHHRRYTREGLESLLSDNGFTVERLEWMNLTGIPGWFVNGRLFRRRAVPPLQLRLYDAVAPLLARLEARVTLPVGMSLFAVARVRGETAPA